MDVFKTLILDTPDSLDNISGVLPIVNGGTGADNASDARDNLGLGTIATQDANAVVITGGSATGLTSLGVVDNTTLGSSNTDTVTFNARIASEFTPATDNTYDLGRTGHEWRDLYLDGTANIDSLIADTADINGGTIDGTTIGATTPAAGTFSQVNSTGAIIATGAGSFGDDTDVTGDLTVTGEVTSTASLRTTGAEASNLAASASLGYVGADGKGRLLIQGPDTSTDGSLRIRLTRSDGSNSTAVADFTPTGLAVTGAGSFTGNVGVGTTAPTAKFVVAGGGAAIQGNGFPTTGAGWEFYTDTTTGSWAQSYSRTSSAWLDANWNALTHKYSTSGGERMRITSGGNVGIGTTSPAYQLQLSTDSAAKPSTNTWTIASDARIKTETGEYTKGLDAVLSLRPVTYRYNGKAGMVDDGEDKISIIAQEAINAFPECVGSYMTKLDEDDEEETEVLNWNGHALTFALVNSIKELTARLEALENN
jgi:hypothetical protein